MPDTTILAIESSCDETAAAVVQPGGRVLSSIIHSQIEIHAPYGGVVPEIASRHHLQALPYVTEQALQQAGLGLDALDAVAVTYGPGLSGALLCGVNYAKALAYARGLPLVGVNHIEGHICANHITHPGLQAPYIALVVSGGHTLLVHVEGELQYETIGRSNDDAAGEAFDKAARALGLGYPGGPELEALAREGDENAYQFTRPKLERPLDFSFSGIKTAVINLLHTADMKGETLNRADIAASFQRSVAEFLLQNALAACEQTGCKRLSLCGGVCANGYLRAKAEELAKQRGLIVYLPEKQYCTDNAAMIGCAAHLHLQKGDVAGMDLNAVPNLSLSSLQD